MNSEMNAAKLYPLTAMQQGMLFHFLREPSSHAYFQQLQVSLEGELDIAKLQQAWQQLLRHYSALAMRFNWDGDQPRQQVQSEAELPFKVIDYRDQPMSAHAQLRQAFLSHDKALGFSLNNAPLMRVSLLLWSANQWEMIWSHHHLLLDGWSAGLLLANLNQIYTGLLQGDAIRLAPERPFSDFLSFLDRRDKLAAQAYWQRNLQDFESAGSLPVFKPANQASSKPGQVAQVHSLLAELSQNDGAALQQLCQQLSITTVTPVLACWGLLLSRYVGRDDVVFGVTTSGRPAELAGVEQMVGLFINTIPLRIKDWHGKSEIGDCLSALHRNLAAAREHEHTSLSQITEWCQSAALSGNNMAGAHIASPSGAPSLFDTIVVYENYPVSGQSQTLGTSRVVNFHLQEESNYPLSLIVEPQAQSLHFRLLADTQRISVARAEAILAHYVYFLQQLAHAAPTHTLKSLQLLPPAQRQRQLQEWNATYTDYDTQATMVSLFIDQVKRTPQALALVDADGSLSYAELQARVGQLQAAITQLALPDASPIAVRITRNREMLIALLAVLASGHHYVPIEPGLPEVRVGAIFDSLPVACMLTVTSLAESSQSLCQRTGMAMICVDQTQNNFASLLVNRAVPTAPAYVIFTSGSTGKPKGVLVIHRKAVNLISWVNHTFKIGAHDKLLFVTSPAFDLSVYDIFGILAAGGVVRIASENELADPECLLKILTNEAITFWDSAPAALWQLEPLLPKMAVSNQLRLIFLSGDWLPLALPERMKQSFPNVNVVALGGATEATIWSNYHIVQDIQADWVSIPYGRPIQNARYYILDRDLQPVPVGVPGDLYIGGDCLAEGYVGQPELTAERFLADPYAHPQQLDRRMYKTGDRARFFEDGVMEFLGRLDNQIKIRGFRIELGDIEVALQRHAAIRDAICIVHDYGSVGPASADTDKVLIAYYVLQPSQFLTVGQIRQYLQQQLPAAMIPTHLIQLEKLPVSVNGKVDRKNLPLPDATGEAANLSQFSNNPVYDMIAAAWCEVLSLSSVKPEDDFFSLGGHSLRATAVMARLRQAFGVELPLRLIFESPVLQELTQAISLAITGQAKATTETIPQLDRSAGLALSHAQSRLWFLHQIDPTAVNYNVALAARIDGKFDQTCFVAAVKQVISSHDVLNCRIAQIDGIHKLVPLDDGGAECELPELAPTKTGTDPWLAQLNQLARQSFALANERPVKVFLLPNTPQQVYVLILMHHIATDAWGISLFAEELLQRYDELSHGRKKNQACGLQYPDFMAWWEAHQLEHYRATELQYWKQQLQDLVRLNLPLDMPRPQTSSGAGARLSFRLDAHLSQELRRLARRQSATLFMVLLTAFEVVLRHRSGQDEIVVGTDIAGRDHPLAEKIQGFFVNQLVLRSNFSGLHDFLAMLEHVRQVTLAGFFHQHLPFDKLVEVINPPRDAGGMPLFQHKFVLQNAPLAQLHNQDFTITPLELHTATAKYDLLLTLIDEAELHGTLEYSTELFHTANAESLIREFLAVLRQVVLDVTLSYQSLSAMLSSQGQAREEVAKRELRKSGLQRLRELQKTGMPS